MTSEALTATFSRNIAGLRCVWSVTGKANHPLDCQWIFGEMHRRHQS